jgi:hypothetical protein
MDPCCAEHAKESVPGISYGLERQGTPADASLTQSYIVRIWSVGLLPFLDFPATIRVNSGRLRFRSKR